jgi:hypothetical protein
MNYLNKLLYFKKLKLKSLSVPFYFISFLYSKNNKCSHITKNVIQKYNFLSKITNIKFPLYFYFFQTQEELQKLLLSYNNFSHLVYLKFKYIIIYKDSFIIKLLQTKNVFLNINIIISKFFYLF